MKQLHYACTELKDKNEIAIIHKYGCNAKQYTMIITSEQSYMMFYSVIYFI
jgi:hypothetical protein